MTQPIPLNVQTLYADLLQSSDLHGAIPAATIKRKRVKGEAYLYASVRVGAKRTEHYIGPESSNDAQAQAAAYKQAEARAKGQRATVQMLRRAGMLAPPMSIGRVIEALSAAGLFERGLTLVGTHAFRLYPLALGMTWPGAAFATNDIDVSAAAFEQRGDPVDMAEILRNAGLDPELRWHDSSQLPARFVIGDVEIDVLTKSARGGKNPIEIKPLAVAAEALPFQDYLTDEAMDAIALHGAGVRVRVPVPERYAVHKLIVAQRRGFRDVKRSKDLQQARDLIEAINELDPDVMPDALDAARKRGPKWRSAINASLREIDQK